VAEFDLPHELHHQSSNLKLKVKSNVDENKPKLSGSQQQEVNTIRINFQDQQEEQEVAVHVNVPDDNKANMQTKCCHLCGGKDSKSRLKKCARCRAVYYCNAQCQQADWKCHKVSCVPV